MQKSRQELIDLIESGQFQGKKNNKNLVVIIPVLIIVCLFCASFLSAFSKIRQSNSGAGMAFSGIMPVFLVLFISIVFLSGLKSRSANLGKLSQRDKGLILHGDKIEAELDSIDQKRGGYQIKCSAGYQGQERIFVSPVIGVRPIPFEKKKIDVFVDSQNPDRYLVNFYEHIPLADKGGVLQDRSELKCEPHPQAQNVSDKGLMVAVTVICCMVAGGISLVNLVFLIVGIATMKTGGFNFGSIAVNLFVLIMVPTFTFLIIRGAKNSVSASKAVLAQGYYIEAVGDRAWTTSDDDGDTTYHLSARYIEPKTKIMHEFTDSSSSSWISKLVGAKIRVYVNPDNTEQYVMCSREAEKGMGFTASREDNNE